MSEDETQVKLEPRSFEERVFARFDAIDSRLSGLDARLSTLEEKVDARLRETRPIWEAVLVRADNIDEEIKSINRRFRILYDDIFRARENQEQLSERVTKLESEPAH